MVPLGILDTRTMRHAPNKRRARIGSRGAGGCDPRPCWVKKSVNHHKTGPIFQFFVLGKYQPGWTGEGTRLLTAR